MTIRLTKIIVDAGFAIAVVVAVGVVVAVMAISLVVTRTIYIVIQVPAIGSFRLVSRTLEANAEIADPFLNLSDNSGTWDNFLLPGCMNGKSLKSNNIGNSSNGSGTT